MDFRRKHVQVLLHSGAAALFLAAIVLYASSSFSIALGAIGIAVEVVAWLRWLGDRKADAD